MTFQTTINLDLLKELHAKGMHPDEMAPLLKHDRDAIIQQLHVLKLEWARKEGGRAKTPDEVEDSIVTRYVAGEGATTIAKSFGIAKKSVYNILTRKGVGTRSVASRRIAHKQKTARVSARDESIAARYARGEKMIDIATAEQVCEHSVRYSLRKQGLFQTDEGGLRLGHYTPKPRVATKKTTANDLIHHRAFDSFNTVSLYWLGFLLADGCVYDKRSCGQYRTAVQLQRGDKGHLEKLKKWLNAPGAILDGSHFSFGKTHTHSHFSVVSTAIGRQLMSLGVRTHADGRFVSPFVKHSRDFWRGLVDGDGSISTHVYLSGNNNIVTHWAEYCDVLLNKKDSVTIREQPGCFVGTVRFKEDATQVLHTLYKGCDVYLDRKYQTYLEKN